MIETLRELDPHHALRRDSDSGIAWIAKSTGQRYTVHPKIVDEPGAIHRMQELGWHGARTVKCHGFIYNIDEFGAFDECHMTSRIGSLNDLVAAECRCGGKH